MSVGLLAVYLQYGLYVFGHRSKFINTMQFKLPLVSLSVFGRPTIGYNGLRLGEGGDFHHLGSAEIDTKNYCFFTHKTVIRSTEPPLL